MKNAQRVSMAIRTILDANRVHVLKRDAISPKAVRLHTAVLVVCVNPAILAISVKFATLAIMVIQRRKMVFVIAASVMQSVRCRVNAMRLAVIVAVEMDLVGSIAINAKRPGPLYRMESAKVSLIKFSKKKIETENLSK